MEVWFPVGNENEPVAAQFLLNQSLQRFLSPHPQSTSAEFLSIETRLSLSWDSGWVQQTQKFDDAWAGSAVRTGPPRPLASSSFVNGQGLRSEIGRAEKGIFTVRFACLASRNSEQSAFPEPVRASRALRSCPPKNDKELGDEATLAVVSFSAEHTPCAFHRPPRRHTRYVEVLWESLVTARNPRGPRWFAELRIRVGLSHGLRRLRPTRGLQR